MPPLLLLQASNLHPTLLSLTPQPIIYTLCNPATTHLLPRLPQRRHRLVDGPPLSSRLALLEFDNVRVGYEMLNEECFRGGHMGPPPHLVHTHLPDDPAHGGADVEVPRDLVGKLLGLHQQPAYVPGATGASVEEQQQCQEKLSEDQGRVDLRRRGSLPR